MKPFREAALFLRELREQSEEAFEAALLDLTPDELTQIERTWQWWARPKQLRPEGCQRIWLRQCGRGEGKTRSAAEEVLDLAEDWGSIYRGILISKTIGDVRKVMIRGESGLEACARRRGYEVRYVVSDGVVYFPGGGQAYVCTSEKPDGPRGLQSNHVWGDEISSWYDPITCLMNLWYANRLKRPGGPTICTFTTTPKPNPIMFTLHRPPWKERTTVTRASTWENEANIDQEHVESLHELYDGTTMGRQESEGELLEGLGAIFSQDLIHKHRVSVTPELSRRVVSLDPSIDDKDTSDAAGIVVVGCDDQAAPHAYLLDDRTVMQAEVFAGVPEEDRRGWFATWARAAVEAFVAWDCDCVVAEINQGGKGIVEAIEVAAAELGEELGLELSVPVRTVWAKESKRARAEPVGALYERGRVHHVGLFAAAEREMSGWMPGMPSPNRMDAIVQGVSHLLLAEKQMPGIGSYL